MENKIKIHVVKYRWLWMCVSALFLLPGIITMIYASINSPSHLPLKVCIDYTGCTVLQYSVDKKVENISLTSIRTALVKNGIENPSLQIINVNDNITNSKTKDIIAVRTKFIAEDDTQTADKITSVVKSEYQNSELISTTSVGPTLGKELFKNSLIALALACLGLIVYLSFNDFINNSVFFSNFSSNDCFIF